MHLHHNINADQALLTGLAPLVAPIQIREFKNHAKMFLIIALLKKNENPRIVNFRIYPDVDFRLYPRVDLGSSQNLQLPPRIYPPFCNLLRCFRIPESTPPSQNIPPFQQIYMCDPPRIYPSLSEYTPLSTNLYV